MTKKRKVFVGLGACLSLLLSLHFLSSALFSRARLDMTAEGLYTLSDGTRDIVANLEESVDLALYWSASAAKDIPQMQHYAQRVREFLEELVLLSNDKLRLKVIDPEPFSEAEDAATAAGIAALSVDGAGTKMHLGLTATNSVDEQEVIAFFDPSKESFLEYDVARLIHSLDQVDLPKVALISSLQMEGRFNPQNPRGGMTPPWQILAQMRQSFAVEIIAEDAEALPEDADILMVVHPKELSENLLKGIDQWALAGKNLMVFVDPHCEFAAPDPSVAIQQGVAPDPQTSQFGNLLDAWGVSWKSDEFIGDRQWAQKVRLGGRGLDVVDYIAWLGIGKESLNQEDPITGALDVINSASIGWFEIKEGAAVTLEPFMQSSEDSAPFPANRIAMYPDPVGLLTGFFPTGKQYTLAGRLKGTLTSAFPAEDGQAATGTAGGILLFADADFLADRYWISEERMGPISLGWRMTADNGSLVMNALETMAGSQALLGLRGRGNAQRPFHRVEKLRQQAEANYLARETELQTRIRAGESRINELGRKNEQSNMMILSDEQKAEISRVQEEMLAARKELRQVRHSLQKDIDSLGRNLMWLNTVGTPFIAASLALLWTSHRNRKRRVS